MKLQAEARAELKKARRAVIKIGSALLAKDKGFAKKAAKQIAELQNNGMQIVVVTSGAIALGLPLMALPKRPADLPSLQAAAALGQVRLMALWENAFAENHQYVGQILLTHADLASRRRYLNARDAISCLLEHSIVPIINENDSVSVDEIKLGDNDTLAAEVAGLISADVLLLLTGAEGLFTAPPEKPEAMRIPYVPEINDALHAMAGPPALFGTGGMQTKIQAAEIARRQGTATVIACGDRKNVLADVFCGHDIGTLFAKEESPQASRKLWISSLRAKGIIDVDEGAKKALHTNGSLLYAGVKFISGNFEKGDAVDLRLGTNVFARGLISLGVDDAQKTVGLKTEKVRTLIGDAPRVLLHRDDIVWLES